MTTFEERVAKTMEALSEARMTWSSEEVAKHIVRALDALPAPPVVVSEELRREMARVANDVYVGAPIGFDGDERTDWLAAVDAILGKLPRNPVVVTDKMVERGAISASNAGGLPWRECSDPAKQHWREVARETLEAALSPSADAAKDDAGRADATVMVSSPIGAFVGSGVAEATILRGEADRFAAANEAALKADAEKLKARAGADNLATLARAAADEWQKSYGTTDRDVAAWRALADQHEANERRLAQMERFLDAIAQGNGDAIRKHNERIAALETAFAALQHKLDAVAEAAATWRAAKTWEKNSDPIIDALAALGGE